MKHWTLPLLLALTALAGCSESSKGGDASGAAAFRGEASKPGAFLAYEHQVSIHLAADKVAPRLAAAREACNDGRFGTCDLLAIEQSQGGYRAGQLVLRIVPEGVEKMVALAAEGGELESRNTRAEDLAQAVGDNARTRERLERQYKTLEEFQGRKDLAVADLLALAREMAELEVQLAATNQEAAQQQRRIATNLLTLDFTTDQQRPSRLSRIGDAAAGLLDNATEGTAQALEMLGYGIPFVIILFPLALLVRWLWRKSTRRGKAAAQP
ncbi:DUF4349 domain-containing protein [Pseudomonas tohonis]|uniref:DUF4349 domain-containing protein n=1 Tax=Pseudomonas tohonis TaxID=2725477 RepID=UPI0035A25A33